MFWALLRTYSIIRVEVQYMYILVDKTAQTVLLSLRFRAHFNGTCTISSLGRLYRMYPPYISSLLYVMITICKTLIKGFKPLTLSWVSPRSKIFLCVTYCKTYNIIMHFWLKVILTVKSSGCLLSTDRFGVLIINYICNFLIWPSYLQFFQFKKMSSLLKGAKSLFN